MYHQIRLIATSLLVLLFAGKVVMAGVFLPAMIPIEINGWVSAQDRTYDRDTLFEYINGGAELYLSYDFDRLESRTYTRKDQPDIEVDVFDMKSSRNAFGVFSHAREIVDFSYGQGSQYTEGLLLFWKGKYFVSILASPETPEAKDTVHELARRIESAISDTGPLPDILAVLPRDGLIEESLRYFFHYIWLNSHYFIADENILNIDEDCEALLAAYKREGGRTFLVVVRYGGEKDAEAAYKSFYHHYLPEVSDELPVDIEDGSWTGCRRDGDLLVLVFNAASAEQTTALITTAIDLNNRR
jgi:hypothetical protein